MWSGDLKASLRIAAEKSIHKTSSTVAVGIFFPKQTQVCVCVAHVLACSILNIFKDVLKIT